MIQKDYVFNSIYAALLRRDAEGSAMLALMDSQKPLSNIIDEVLKSNEYLGLKANDFLLGNIEENIKAVKNHNVTMIQTADSEKYRDMLFLSGRFNSYYCSIHEIDYELMIGLRYGCKPFHAMFNRIKILQEFVQKGYSGWVIYLDADNLIQDRNYDLKQTLSNLEREKVFLFYNHHKTDDIEYDFWNINSGFFAMKIGDPIVNMVINTWQSLYSNFYSRQNYESFEKWGDLINDQNSLNMILKNIDVTIPLKDKCLMRDFSDGVIAWFGRSEEDPTMNDVSNRSLRLLSTGKSVYPEINL